MLASWRLGGFLASDCSTLQIAAEIRATRRRRALSLFCRQFTRRNFGSYHPGTGEDRLNYTGDRPELARYLSWKQERRARDGPTQGPPPPDTDGRAAATAKWRGDLLPLSLSFHPSPL